MPGSALTSPSTTRRRVGATEITRHSLRMRRARKTESPWAAGTSAMATMTKAKVFQPSRENCQRSTTILAASSNTEIVRHAASNASTRGPARAIMTSEVSTPGTMALNRMTPGKKDRKCRCSIRFSKRSPSGKANVPGMDQRKSSIWALVRAASRPRTCARTTVVSLVGRPWHRGALQPGQCRARPAASRC